VYTPNSGSNYTTSARFIIQEVNNATSDQNAPPTVTLMTSPNPARVGQPVLMTATVPLGVTGTVQFVEGTTVLGTGTISGTTATFTTTSLAIGTHLVKGVYGGNSYYSAATSAILAQVIRNALESTVPELVVNPSTPVYGQPVTFVVSVPRVGSILPTGTVTIYYDGEPIGSGTLGSDGVASVTLPGGTLPAGTGTIIARYNGDQTYAPSSTPSGSITVTPAANTVTPAGNLDFILTLTAGQNQTVTSGQAAPIAVQIAPTGRAYPGVVTFTATGLPPGATISFSPSILATDKGPTPVDARVQTAAAFSARKISSDVTSVALGMLLLPLAGARCKSRQAINRYFVLAIVLLAGIATSAGLAGCGFGYLQHTYNITITATSGTVQHSIRATLNVQ
jgi:hypothetical protein